MDIIHVVIGRPKPEASNGVLKSVYHLAVEQGRCGCKVGIVSIRKVVTSETIVIADNVVMHTFPIRWNRFSLSADLVHFVDVSMSASAIVHFHSAYHPEYWRISSKLIKLEIPYIVSPRGAYQVFSNKKNFMAKRIYKIFFERKIFDNAKLVHALTLNEKNNCIAYGVSSSKISIIPNGVNVSSISALKERLPSRSKDGFFRMVYCGRLDFHYKGLDLLVESMKVLVRDKRYKNVLLYFIGPDWNSGKQEILKLAASYGLSSSLVFCGEKFGVEKYEIYANADLFVLVSRTEGMPTSVIEAMAFELPCLITPETNIDEKVGADGGCFFVKGEVSHIVEAIETAIHSDKLEDVGRQAQKWVLAELTYEMITKQHLSNYSLVVNRKLPLVI